MRSTTPFYWGRRGGGTAGRPGAAAALAGVLELGHELATAVDLEGAQRERQGAGEVLVDYRRPSANVSDLEHLGRWLWATGFRFGAVVVPARW